jgi:hypothetical protein
LSSSPAWAFGGEDLGRLLAQPALRSKPASLAGCRGDPWDVSLQVGLPLIYPDSHPHDIRDQKVHHQLQSNLVEHVYEFGANK